MRKSRRRGELFQEPLRLRFFFIFIQPFFTTG